VDYGETLLPLTRDLIARETAAAERVPA